MDLQKEMFNAVDKTAKEVVKASFGDKSFPDAAFIVEHGAEKDDNGKTLQKFRHLPHHNKNVKSPTENSTVDLPHLRNALARVGQVKPIKEDSSGFISRARAHLEKHAKVLLKTNKQSANFKKIQDLCKEFNIIED